VAGQLEAARLLLVTVDDVQQVETTAYGMDLVPEVARLLGSANIRSTRLGEEMTLWHAEDGPGKARAGQPNPTATRLAAEHGLPPVTGTVVITGPIQYNSLFPLDAAAADRIAARLRG
jgi:hypothetical protein